MAGLKNTKLYKKLVYILSPIFLFVSSFLYFLKDILKYFKEGGSILDTISNAKDLLTLERAYWLRIITFILLAFLLLFSIFRFYRNKHIQPLNSRIKILKNEGIVLSVLIAALIISLIPIFIKSNKSDIKTNHSDNIQKVANKANNKFKIIIANFEGPDQLGFGVSGKIYDKLSPLSNTYQDVEVVKINQVIDKNELAKQLGEELNANLVIWGHYFATNTNAEVYFNFDFPQQIVANFLNDMKTEIPPSHQTIKDHRRKLDDFTIQGSIADELSYIALLTLGVIHLDKGEGKKALETLSKAIRERKSSKNNSEFYQPYLLRSFAHELNGDHENSIADLKKVIEKQPDKPIAYLLLAHTYIRFGQTKEINANYDKAISLTQNSTPLPDIYICRCYYYLITVKDYEKAQKDCDKAVTLNGEDDAYLARGILQSILFDELLKNPGNRDILNEGNSYIDGAISDISKAIELFIHPSYYSNRAVAYIKKSRITKNEAFLTKALQDCNKALELNSLHQHSYLVKSEISLIYKDLQKWQFHYDKAIALANDYEKAILYYERGSIFLDWEDFENAISDFEKSIKLIPDFLVDGIPVNHKYGIALYRIGDYDKALIAFEKVLTLNRNYASALRMKGQTLYYLGNKKQAIVYCEKSRRLALKKKLEDHVFLADQCLRYIRSN